LRGAQCFEIRAQPRLKTVSRSSGKRCKTTITRRLPHWRGVSASGTEVPSDSQQIGETDFSLFRAFRPKGAGFKHKKSSAAHHPLRNDPVMSWLTSLADARTWGIRSEYQVNRAINLAIRPMSDLTQHGEIEVWSPPLVTFTSGAGDCEDYAMQRSWRCAWPAFRRTTCGS
jgi:predicted transglutaminase-like cysteine proteinase